MSIVGSLCLLVSTFQSPDGKAIRQHGFFYGWTPLTLVMFFLVFDDGNANHSTCHAVVCINMSQNYQITL